MSINATSMRNPLQILHSIKSRTTEITNRIWQSTITRIEALPESYPKTMQALEPSICALFKFINNHPNLFKSLIIITMITTIVVQSLLLVSCLSQIIPLTPVTNLSLIAICLVIDIVFIKLIDSIFSQVGRKQLDQALIITKITAAFFNLDPEFVSALNTWTNETYELNKNWHKTRIKIIRFYQNSNYYQLCLKDYQLHSLPDIFDTPGFRKLQMMDLSKNQLATLPASIKNLQLLKYLDLRENITLSNLPEEVLTLPQTCTVYI